jgi:hypothetical protein
MNPKEQLDRITYEQMCQQFGLKPEWLDKTFQAKGKTYTIVGLNIRSKRFPVLVTYDSTYTIGDNTKTVKSHGAWNATHVIGFMTGNLDGELKKANEKRLAEERKNWSMAAAFGLKTEWLDRTFKHRHNTVTIVGLAPNRRRYPINQRNEIAFYPLTAVIGKVIEDAVAA